MIHETTDTTFQNDTQQGVQLIDFWAQWCGPCRMQTPVVEELAETMGNQVSFHKLNVDCNQATAKECQIMSIPTLVIKKDGVVVDKISGYHSKEQLAQVLQAYLEE